METKRLPEVRIFLLGPMRIERDGQEVHLPTRKAQSLLAYLLLHPGDHSREKLATLLWGDSPDKEARGSLRAALASYRRDLAPDVLLAGRDTAQINPSFPLWLDTRTFESQSAQALAAPVPEPSVLELALYRDELLQDLYDDWILPLRQHYHTLRQLVDWSYDLLNEAEQALLCRLAVFAGNWSLEAAECVCSGGKVEQHEVPYLLSCLVDKSLVLAVPTASEMRYRLLLVIRQYAGAKLEAAGESEQVRTRLLEFLLELAEATAAGSAASLRTLELERNNIRSALDWQAGGTTTAESQLRLAVMLGRFWQHFGYLHEGSTWTERCYARATAADPGLLARAAVQAASFARGLGDYKAAVTWGRQGLELCRRLGDKRGAGEALCDLGVVAHFEGDRDRAVEALEESLGLLQGTAAPWQRLKTLLWLGDVQMRRGLAVEAAATWQASLTLARELGDQWGIGFSLGGLGDLARTQGDYARAGTFLTESLKLHHEAGFKVDLCYVLEGLALLAALQGWQAGSLIRPAYLRHAARLWGAAEALRESIHAPAPPSYRESYAPEVSRSRAELDRIAVPGQLSLFTSSWQEGRALTWDQLLEQAMTLHHSALP